MPKTKSGLLRQSRFAFFLAIPNLKKKKKLGQMPPAAKFNDFEAENGPFPDRKADHSAHQVKPLLPASARIDMQQAKCRIPHNFEYMGMPANE